MANVITNVGTSSTPASFAGVQPAKFVYNLNDVSAPDAGRTEDATMYKLRIAQKVTLDLQWNGVTSSQASVILQVFNPEYVYIKFLSPFTGGYETKRFYIGDRSAPCYNSTLDLWENVAFKAIEQ